MINGYDIKLINKYGEHHHMCWYGAEINGENGFITEYSSGLIKQVIVAYNKFAVVEYFSGAIYEWQTNLIDSYNYQFGLTVSLDGRFVFVQSWESGLLCLNAHTGKIVWKTKSRCGITTVYSNDNTLVCHQRERALQLLDIETGIVIKEKKPAKDWGFYILKEGYIICQMTARNWEIINTHNLETIESVPSKQINCDGWSIRKMWIDEGKLKYELFRYNHNGENINPQILEKTGEIEINYFNQQ